MTKRSDHFIESARLRALTHDAGFHFLMVELRAGLALLETAETSRLDNAKERRLALAAEAYDVVAERLARRGPSAPELSDEERRTLTTAHNELGRRLGR
jgi:hypothetical protein